MASPKSGFNASAQAKQAKGGEEEDTKGIDMDYEHTLILLLLCTHTATVMYHTIITSSYTLQR
jgi:hypothetical protein